MKINPLKLMLTGLFVLAGTQLHAADGPLRAPTPRAGLFFEEVWQQLPKGGEYPVTPQNVVNQDLDLKLYGPQGDRIGMGGIADNDTNPPHIWTGECGAGCSFALRSKTRYADLTGTARIMVQTKTSGFHKVHPFIKLADGTTYIGDLAIGNSRDFLYTEFRIDELTWNGFDAQTGLTMRAKVEKPDLSKVDEIGFTDLSPGSGHGQQGWSDVGTIRVYANAVPR
jgi:hypothetical protein